MTRVLRRLWRWLWATDEAVQPIEDPMLLEQWRRMVQAEPKVKPLRRVK